MPQRTSLEMALDALTAQFQSGQHADCIAPGKDLYDEAMRSMCPDVAAAAAALVALAMSNVRLHDEVASWAERALSLYVSFGRHDGDDDDLAHRLDDSAAVAWVALAVYQAHLGGVPEALRAMTAAQVSLGARSSETTRVLVHTGVGIAYYRMGLPMQALESLRRGLEAANERVPLTQRFRMQLNVLFASFDAYDLLADADTAEAAQLVATMQTGREAAERMCREIDTDAARAALAPAAAAACYRAGDLQAARAWLAPTLVHGELRNGQRDFETYALLALIEQALGNEDAAQAAAKQGSAILAQVNLARASPHRLWYAARLSAIQGHYQEAIAIGHRQLGLVVHNHNAALGARMAQLSANLYLQALRTGEAPAAPQSLPNLGELTQTDPLTGLANRHHLARRFVSLQAEGEIMTLVVMDLDRFRQINLRHSHSVGDQVLYQMGQLIRSSLRGQDELARLGGKSFALLMPGANATAASVIMRRVRQRVGRHNWAMVAPDLGPLTYSGGMIEVQRDESFPDALMRVDALVRAAKQAGPARTYFGRMGEGGMAEVF